MVVAMGSVMQRWAALMDRLDVHGVRRVTTVPVVTNVLRVVVRERMGSDVVQDEFSDATLRSAIVCGIGRDMLDDFKDSIF